MPAKMAKSAPSITAFGLPEATAVVRAASLSCQNEGKAPKFSRNRESSGKSRYNRMRLEAEFLQEFLAWAEGSQ